MLPDLAFLLICTVLRYTRLSIIQIRLSFPYYTFIFTIYQKRPYERRTKPESGRLWERPKRYLKYPTPSLFFSYRTLVFADYQKGNRLDVCAAVGHQQNSTIDYPMMPVRQSRDSWLVFYYHTYFHLSYSTKQKDGDVEPMSVSAPSSGRRLDTWYTFLRSLRLYDSHNLPLFS